MHKSTVETSLTVIKFLFKKLDCREKLFKKNLYDKGGETEFTIPWERQCELIPKVRN